MAEGGDGPREYRKLVAAETERVRRDRAARGALKDAEAAERGCVLRAQAERAARAKAAERDRREARNASSAENVPDIPHVDEDGSICVRVRGAWRGEVRLPVGASLRALHEAIASESSTDWKKVKLVHKGSILAASDATLGSSLSSASPQAMFTVAAAPIHAQSAEAAAAEVREAFREVASVPPPAGRPARSFPQLHAFQNGAVAAAAAAAPADAPAADAPAAAEATAAGASGPTPAEAGIPRFEAISKGKRNAIRMRVRRAARGDRAIPAPSRFPLLVRSPAAEDGIATWARAKGTMRAALRAVLELTEEEAGRLVAVAVHDGQQLDLDTALVDLNPRFVVGDTVFAAVAPPHGQP